MPLIFLKIPFPLIPDGITLTSADRFTNPKHPDSYYHCLHVPATCSNNRWSYVPKYEQMTSLNHSDNNKDEAFSEAERMITTSHSLLSYVNEHRHISVRLNNIFVVVDRISVSMHNFPAYITSA